jgi:hypothetical protein
VSTLAFHFSLLAVSELVLQEKEDYVHKLSDKWCHFAARYKWFMIVKRELIK